MRTAVTWAWVLCSCAWLGCATARTATYASATVASADEVDVDGMREAVFRTLMSMHPEERTLFCLGIRAQVGLADPSAALLERFDDVEANVEPLSRCKESPRVSEGLRPVELYVVEDEGAVFPDVHPVTSATPRAEVICARGCRYKRWYMLERVDGVWRVTQEATNP